MNEYGVLLTEELEEAYRNISESLGMSMEQTLTEALELFMERLTLETRPSLADDSKLREIAR